MLFSELFLVWWEIWVWACDTLTNLQPGLLRVEKSLSLTTEDPNMKKPPTQIRGVSRGSVLELQMNNVMVFIFTGLSHVS